MAVQAKRKAWELALLAVVTVLLLSACKSSDAEEEEPVKQPTMLNIYVYTPDNPTVTRADEGNVLADQDERAVESLHIWVFTHDDNDATKDGRKVGYLNPSSSDIRKLSSSDQNTVVYQMLIPDWYILESPRPKVDVYVMANVTATTCGLTLNGNTTRDELDDAQIKHTAQSDYFGLTTLVTSVPVDDELNIIGLPMSGVLKNLTVKGDAPVLRIVRNDDDDNMAKVNLVRAVSKIRFIFSKSTANEQAITINSISLDAGVLPTEENLFLDGAYTAGAYKVGSSYNTSAATLVSEVSTINSCDNPASFAYQVNETGQAYETRINEGLKAHTVENVTTPAELSELGRFFLRESDKKLKGTISYTVDGSPRNPTTFEMAADGDFSRNHTWIVYAYFVSGDLLHVNTVDVKSWGDPEQDKREVFNW